MLRALPLIVASALLSACASAPTLTTPPGQAVDASRLLDWTAAGRLAMTVAGDGGSANFTWRQRAAVTDLEVRGPFGVGALKIVVDGDALTVTDAAGITLDAAVAREQIRARLGADVPVAWLRYWLLGLAAPDSPAQVEQRTSPPLRLIEQAGWQVSYEQFRVVQGWSVPTRLTCSGGDARIRVIVDDWQLPSAGVGPEPGIPPP
jgi:outer membrane lipoprotein LolB